MMRQFANNCANRAQSHDPSAYSQAKRWALSANVRESSADIFYCAIEASVWAVFSATEHGEPGAEITEKNAQAEDLRRIMGNPFLGGR